MKRKFVFILLLIIMTGLLTACWDQRIYEKIGFALVHGMEKGEGDNIKFTDTIPIITGKEKESSQYFVSEGKLIREGTNKTMLKAPFQMEGGKVQQILISKELAFRGIHELIEIVQRDAINNPLANVSIVDGSPNELITLAVEQSDKPIPAKYLNALMRGNVKSGSIPDIRVSSYDIDYFTEGKDPMVPLIKYTPKEIEIEGTALLHNDKMVGQIKPNETQLLLSMMKKAKDISQVFTSIPKEEGTVKQGMALAMRLKKRDLKVQIKDNRPIVDIKLEFSANIDEYMWDNLDKDNKLKYIESKASNELENNCKKVLKYTQEVGSDPIGIGHIIKAKYNGYWENVDWNSEYKKVDFHVSGKVRIKGYGTLN